MYRIALAAVPLLAACGLSEDDFHTAFPADLCAYAETCVEGDTDDPGDPLEATCEEALTATVTAFANDATCAYDAGQAQACLDAIAAGSCDDSAAVRDACAPVYGGETCNLTLTDYL